MKKKPSPLSKAAPRAKARRALPGATAAAEKSPAGLVRDLIDQFDDPLTFYRELIQNSIDAGSNRIDVRLGYEPGRPGRAVVEVEDDGEGMDEKIIDDYLLVLFASTKENDYTKIGKFGIGFMSVFSPRPQLVRVHTAKSGQSWRLDFPSPKRFEKYRVDAKREGTLVELFKAMSPTEYRAFAKASRATIAHWCRHAEARIWFRDKSERAPAAEINEPFDLPGGHSLRYAEEGTELVLGFTSDPAPFYGYYNRGLTLKEGEEALYPGVTFKVKSRYLEHTLTRDNVLRDENYRKLQAILKRLVEDELPGRLHEELAAATGRPDAAAVWTPRLEFAKGLYTGFFKAWKRSDWKLFPRVEGPPLSLSEAKDGSRAGLLYHDAKPSRASRVLEARGVPVLADGPWLEPLALWCAAGRASASATFLCPKVLDKVPDETARFLDSLRAVDRASLWRYRDILAADFEELPANVAPPVFLAQREPGAPVLVGERGLPSLLNPKLYALVNSAHPHFKLLERLFAKRPGPAVFLCLKILHLHDGKSPPEERTTVCEVSERLEAGLLAEALRLDELAKAAVA